MKHTTASSDLKKYINEVARRTEADRARSRAIETLDSGDAQQVHACAEAYRDARVRCAAAAAIVATLPKVRREAAKDLHAAAQAHARELARRLGGSYSGETSIEAQWGEKACARTTTAEGREYSRSCRYRKTDAKHLIILSPDTAPCLMQSERIRNASAAEGLPLIALTPAGECTWVRARGKTILDESGWIAYAPDFGGICYHSTQSWAHAAAGLEKKVAKLDAAEQAAAESRKTTRRLQLIARLCRNAVATVDDARSLGYCSPGIAAFQARHGIGDRATLPELMATGDAAAQRLALCLARQVSRQQTVAA
jgi:hypothetical protein